MEKVIIKCNMCYNNCKMFSEAEARLISCPKYLSKRSVEFKKERKGVNILPSNYNRL